MVQCVLTAVNADRGCYTDVNVNLWGLYVVAVSRKPSPCLWSSFTSWFFMQGYIVTSEDDCIRHNTPILVLAQCNVSHLLSNCYDFLRESQPLPPSCPNWKPQPVISTYSLTQYSFCQSTWGHPADSRDLQWWLAAATGCFLVTMACTAYHSSQHLCSITTFGEVGVRTSRGLSPHLMYCKIIWSVFCW